MMTPAQACAAKPQAPHSCEWAARDVVFVSYSRDDAEWMQAFRMMLAPVLSRIGIELWIDTDLRSGDNWNRQIEAAIARSGVALLLISPRFLFSDYIMGCELPALQAQQVRLAPVLVGACAHERVLPELAAVQWLHDPGGDGALNLDADKPGERDRRIWQASERLLNLLPEPAAPPARGVASARGVARRWRIDLAVEAVPIAERPGQLSGVPAAPPGYVAREELPQLIDAVTAAENGAVGVIGKVTTLGLHGHGGIGKSVLAAALARDETVRHRFPDGLFWVTLGEAGDVLAAQLDLLARLDPAAPQPRTLDDAERALRDALASRRVLLIVDDAWSDTAALAFRLTGPHGRVLYTTRDPLVLEAVGARTFPVEVLSVAAARELAAAVLAGTDRRRPELPGEADTAIEHVGRVALAVSLLAAAVRGGRSWRQVAAALASDADVFGDHPYANTFTAMQLGVATLPSELADALVSLVVFPRDSRTPVAAVARYWAHTRGHPAGQSRADLRRLAAANLLALDPAEGGSIGFHDLQHDYLHLHAPALPVLHGRLLDAYRTLLDDRDQWWQLPPGEPYIWGRLVSHLRGAGARRELATTITDPAFLAHRIATDGVLATENDLAHAATALTGDPVVNWWRNWLPRHNDLLALVDGTARPGARTRALAPTLRAWLGADPTRPANLDPDRLEALCPDPYLAVLSGLMPASSAQTRVLTGHTDQVRAVAWSPDGTQLATTGDDATVRLWNPSSGRTTATLIGHTGPVSATAWSPDGTRLATASYDATVRLWNPDTGRTIRTLTAHTSPVSAVAWCPHGTRLATASYDGTVRLWNPDTGQTTATLTGHTSRALAVSWSPDGTRLATASYDGTARLWNPDTGRTIRTLIGHTREVCALAWSPDGTRLATASYDATVRLWNPDTGRTIGTLIGHTRRVCAVAWSPDSNGLATASYDATVRLWNPNTGQTTATLTGHTDLVCAVAWSPDGTQLATAGQDRTVRLWSPRTRQATTAPTGHTNWVSTVAWSPDGTQLATAGDDATVRLWNPDTRQTTATLLGHTSRVRTLAWSLDGTQLATAGDDATVRLWNPKTGQTTATLLGHTSRVRTLAWSPDGTQLATAGDDATVRLWNPKTGQTTTTLTGHTSRVRTLAWSPDGTHLAAASHDATVRLWNPDTGQTTTTLTGHTSRVRTLAWSPDATHLATASDDATVRLWNPDTGQTTTTLTGHTSRVRTLAWSPDATHLATASDDATVRLWNPDTGQTTATLSGQAWASAVAWSPDSSHLVAAWSDGEIRVHHFTNNDEPSRLRLSSASHVDWAGERIAAAGANHITMLTLTKPTPDPKPHRAHSLLNGLAAMPA